MTAYKFQKNHAWLAAVLIVAGIITASLNRMSQNVGWTYQDLVRRPAPESVLGAETSELKAVHLVVQADGRSLIDTSQPAEVAATVEELLLFASASVGVPVETQKYDFGTLVTSIGEFTGGTDGKYWLYSVNGQDAAVGIDQYKLTGNELVQFRFASS